MVGVEATDNEANVGVEVRTVRSKIPRILKRAAVLLAVIVMTLTAVRIYDTQRGPPLELWHTYAPPELDAEELDQADWSEYLDAEQAAFDHVRAEVTAKLEAEDRVPVNRYFEGSPVYPGRFAQDWNRSYVLEPEGAPIGAAVFLHGLTDAPYSQRHIAQRYHDLGYVAIAIRLPAHGTVPAALADIEWEDWLAATRLAVREARRRIGPSLPLHLVGFSNGGALAMKYALDAIEDRELSRPDRIVLISPMIGITAFARFAGFAGLPALLPAFAKAAWLANVPEFNPFKYNSFPVNGARQSWQLTQALQRQIVRQARAGQLVDLPPVLTFQSVIDFTVSTRAIIASLYVHLPAGSELVLFDVNRDAKLGPLLRSASDAVLTRLLPAPPRRFRTTIVTNAADGSSEVLERVIEAGAETEQERPLGLSFPPGVFSLSHVALPFPPSDGLYGFDPDPADDFGIRLGAIAPRGEVGALIVSLDSLLRMSSNPFFPYLVRRIAEGIGPACLSCGRPSNRSEASVRRGLEVRRPGRNRPEHAGYQASEQAQRRNGTRGSEGGAAPGPRSCLRSCTFSKDLQSRRILVRETFSTMGGLPRVQLHE
jgi:alpha-beta hydrolase superfamily lysophospholipase